MSQQPSDQEILNIKANDAEEERLDYLADRSHNGQLSKDEDEELKEYLLAQHLMIIAKGYAWGRLKSDEN